MTYNRSIALFLLTVWSISVLHCTADRATGHWHAQASGPVHHHHHDPYSDSHEHRAGEPVDAHSHGSGVTECCEIKVIPASCTRVKTTVVWQNALPIAFSFENALRVNLSRSDIIQDQGESGGVPRPDLVSGTTTLRVPNAPPAIATM